MIDRRSFLSGSLAAAAALALPASAGASPSWHHHAWSAHRGVMRYFCDGMLMQEWQTDHADWAYAYWDTHP